MSRFKTTGYRSKSLFADIVLGVTDGLDSALWCFAFASVIYTGVLSVFMPVGVFTLLIGWAAISIFIVTTTNASLHMANVDEQGVVIIATIGALMVAQLGPTAQTGTGLATLLSVAAITSLLVSVACYLVGRYRLSQLLEMLPFPVICGFMAGIGWLLLDAGFIVGTDSGISEALAGHISGDDRLPRLLLSIACGAGLTWAVNRIEKSWILPVASLVIIAGFFLVTAGMGLSREELLANGWLFEVRKEDGGALAMISALSFSDIDFGFITTVVPEILTAVFLVLLSASMSLGALKAASKTELDSAEEFKNISGGNLLCGLVGCPPGYSDPVASTLYEEFGASSRWMPLASSAVCLLVAFLGGGIIGYIPVVLVGATVFLFAFQTFYEWMYLNVKGFSPSSYVIICAILGTVIFVGFMEGVGIGLILTVLLFVFRYSRISAIQGRLTLREKRSSVERCAVSNAALDRHGADVIVYTLRGFLFFGTANSIQETISENTHIRNGECKAVLMDMSRVTGIDISALNTFTQIKKICDATSVLLSYSAVSPGVASKLEALEAVSLAGQKPLIFDEADFAIEYLEELLLDHGMVNTEGWSIREYLANIIGNDDKVQVLLDAMEPVECAKGDKLFAQGEPDDGLYIVEKGSLSALIISNSQGTKRVKKFRPGSLIGELSAYLPDKKRTATIQADEDSVLYHLRTEVLSRLDHDEMKLALCIHELVARTLAERVDFMNRRLMVEYV